MTRKEHDRSDTARAIRDVFLEASQEELRELVAETGEDFDALAAQGRAVAARALAKDSEDSAQVQDLHRGLGALVRMLRTRDKLSVEALAQRARIAASEVEGIERNPSFDPSPRTIYQLEQYFNLPSRTLVVLSGADRVENDVQAEVVRFAASCKDMSKLSREEKKALNRFVRFLSEHTDR